MNESQSSGQINPAPINPTSTVAPKAPSTPQASMPANSQTQPGNEQAAQSQDPNQPSTFKGKVQLLLINLIDYIKSHFDKIIVIILTIQGLRGLITSVKFIMIEYPILEEQLASHQITQEQINIFANKAIVMLTTTVLSMFFALRISLVQSQIAKKVNSALGVLVIILDRYINIYLTEIGSAQIITNLSISLVNLVKNLSQ
ncbi:MAG: hypothetical protein PVJ09_01365 [Candidatus Woesebacteria bacterium]|jgi:hypothetical protein